MQLLDGTMSTARIKVSSKIVKAGQHPMMLASTQRFLRL